MLIREIPPWSVCAGTVWRMARDGAGSAAGSANFLGVDQVVGKDTPGHRQEVDLFGGRGGQEVQVGGHQPDGDRPTENSTDPFLEMRPPSLGNVPQEGLALGE